MYAATPKTVGPTMFGVLASLLAVAFKQMQQFPITGNKMQQRVQTDATYNIQQCCVRLRGDLCHFLPLSYVCTAFRMRIPYTENDSPFFKYLL